MLGKPSDYFVIYFKFANEEVIKGTDTGFYLVEQLKKQSYHSCIQNDAYNLHKLSFR